MKFDDEGIAPYSTVSKRKPGLGPESAGQSGDIQGLSDVPEAASESVVELVQEGQYVEAQLVQGVEESGEGDVEELSTRQVPLDNVPEEYINPDREREDLEGILGTAEIEPEKKSVTLPPSLRSQQDNQTE